MRAALAGWKALTLEPKVDLNPGCAPWERQCLRTLSRAQYGEGNQLVGFLIEAMGLQPVTIMEC